LRHWVKQAEIDNGQRPGVTTKDQQRIIVNRPEFLGDFPVWFSRNG